MKIKGFIDQYGWSAVPRLFKAVLRKFGIIIETFFLLKYKLNELDITHKFNKYNYSDVRELTEKDISKIKFVSSEKLEIYKNRFHSGDYSCYAIIKNKEIQYLTWISWKDMNYPTIFERKEDLNPDEALLEDSFCSPQHRGRGYHSMMNIFRLKKILDQQKSEVLVLVLKENKPALKVQLKSGFYFDSRIKFIKIGKWIKIFQQKI
ncbi:hypothetical protein [Winogradskyella sediminis]|uniref:hypothetical protein n=1 Tax=Winogradskyella sediminis TaxID=1382466 RepID=UPI000E265833|nr:hypothetical protein [Winogradskyella sediminis]REG89968.1 hypothetical protein C8N41_1011216 [Winogradskyella sediminis]